MAIDYKLNQPNSFLSYTCTNPLVTPLTSTELFQIYIRVREQNLAKYSLKIIRFFCIYMFSLRALSIDTQTPYLSRVNADKQWPNTFWEAYGKITLCLHSHLHSEPCCSPLHITQYPLPHNSLHMFLVNPIFIVALIQEST